MDGGDVGGAGASEGPISDKEATVTSTTSKTVLVLIGLLVLLFLGLVLVSYL